MSRVFKGGDLELDIHGEQRVIVEKARMGKERPDLP